MENLGLSVPFAILALICGISYLSMTLTRRARLLARFPCPGKFPIVGSIPYIFGPLDDAAICFENLIQKFGRRVAIWFGPKPIAVVILAEADGAQKILSSVKHIDKGNVYSQFKCLLGKGLLTSRGQLWKDDRKLLGPSFSHQKLPGFLPYFNKHSRTLVEILTKFQCQATNIHPRLARTTMDFISGSAFAEDSNYRRRQISSSDTNGDGFVSIETLETLAIEKRKTALALEEKCAIPESNENCAIQKPIIDVLLNSKSEKDIIGHIAFETTASGMNYTMFLLALNASAQEKVHLELDSIFGGDINRGVTFKDLSDMKYLEMCIKEALRIYPPIPLIARNAQEDIPLGAQVVILIREILRDPEHFPDPEVFNPDRFLPDECAARHPFAYIPFSAGPRNCLGMKYALIQMKACLAHILRRFRVSTSQERKDISYVYGMMLELKPNLEIVLTPK
ncbi:Cytochrome P450 4c3 [Folsomia candida]|uniref:Cytochrome P450 4c3 n=1 Tax=Folsomia candida TaxID=158441 RepID=A0A226EY85_FOLCA|nr:Cytochrome P450 4c3 [Folsomia candida]